MINPDIEFTKLIELMSKKYSDSDLEMTKLAYDFAKEAHHGQTRLSGDDYIIHPIATAYKLAELELDIDTVLAGLLHDVPEETTITIKDIENDFGSDVAKLVEGITKLGTLKYRGMERYAENLKKMFLAMSEDIRTIFIKFADRIHNLKTLKYLPQEKQIRIAKESIEIYASIANRLGIGKIKGELEDLAFPYIYPEEYQWLIDILPTKYQTKGKYIEKIKKKILQEVSAKKMPFKIISIHGRTKHLYSLYKKLTRPTINKDLNKVHDFIALRIIVPTVADCYSTLGIVHQLYKPITALIKDYISQPKPNGYQSLHTTVLTDNREIVEIQIRTTQMHEEAEYGVAAHWHYKESFNKTKNTDWINQVLSWQKQIKDSQQFIDTIKIDIFQDRIFVFTPHGDVIDLPEESTPVDFAYHVHSNLGDKCVGAIVNDQMISLDSKLKSGDVVEIITDKNRKAPSPNWLKTVKTSVAKNKIKSTLNKIKKENKTN